LNRGKIGAGWAKRGGQVYHQGGRESRAILAEGGEEVMSQAYIGFRDEESRERTLEGGRNRGKTLQSRKEKGGVDLVSFSAGVENKFFTGREG